MFRTASNVIGDIAATIIVAYWENNIDKETYLSKNT
jgi:Na+/H+-dicarboxylate symporter